MITPSTWSLPDIERAAEPPVDNVAPSLHCPLRLAIVGCGAVTEKLHLPGLALAPELQVTALVDPDAERLRALGASVPGVLHLGHTIEGLERYADIALIAVPNHLHATVAADLLQRGLHVLVEKPLTVSLEEANRLIEIARQNGRTLGVALLRRHYPSFDFVRCALQAGWLGRVVSFDWREGMAYAWSAASLSLYRREHGGGVLVDRGSHVLDALLAWLGPVERLRYRDDARGGVEANCLLELELQNGATGVVELSWTRNLRNTCIIRGEQGELEVGIFPQDPVTVRLGHLQIAGTPTEPQTPALDFAAISARQLSAFARAVRTHSPPPASGETALETMRLFDACRARREPLALAWEPFRGDVDWSAFAGKRVLILGGAGFLGARLVAALSQHSRAALRVLVRDYARVPSIARYPVEIVCGDAGDPQALRRAMAGCDYVINCAYGKGSPQEQARVNVEAVGHLIRVARELGVRQVVHVSTVMVYGDPEDGTLTEQSPARVHKSQIYGYTKWKGEELALREGARLGLPVAVIQPTAIYGPEAPSWTWLPIHTLKSGRFVLVNGGTGISNAVYVDDVVTALLRAAIEPRAAGERLLISGPDVVTWREFYAAFDALLGGGRTVSMTTQQIARARREAKKGNIAQLYAILREEHAARQRLLALPAVAPLLRGLERLMPSLHQRLRARVTANANPTEGRVAPADPVVIPNPEMERLYRAAVTVDCTKAANLIGYRPRYSFKEGMALTAEWARWANAL